MLIVTKSIFLFSLKRHECLDLIFYCFNVQYHLCHIGCVYVFYVGHVNRVVYTKPFFHCNILSKHHHHHHFSSIYFQFIYIFLDILMTFRLVRLEYNTFNISCGNLLSKHHHQYNIDYQ
jgi:hypothetical protein